MTAHLADVAAAIAAGAVVLFPSVSVRAATLAAATSCDNNAVGQAVPALSHVGGAAAASGIVATISGATAIETTTGRPSRVLCTLATNKNVQSFTGSNRDDGVHAAADARLVRARSRPRGSASGTKRDYRDRFNSRGYFERLLAAGVLKRLVIWKRVDIIVGYVGRDRRRLGSRAAGKKHSGADAKRKASYIPHERCLPEALRTSDYRIRDR